MPVPQVTSTRRRPRYVNCRQPRLALASTRASDVLIRTIGIESGKAPAWASGWKALPVLSVSSDYLGTAYQMATATGAYAATGTTSGQWMASIVTLKTG